jgi:histidine triad (HIT) family protein
MPVISHEPAGYACPFCLLQEDVFNERNQPADVVAVTARAYARVAPKWWPGNPGAVLVMPRAHIENIYELPAADGHAVWSLVQTVATSMRMAYNCAGTCIRQHNEPAGNQDVWHLHVHAFPRSQNDRLYQRHEEAQWVGPAERESYALKLRTTLDLPYRFDG